ncbi:hypothetical protein [Neptuniibacter halophilus]|uniref:hypothetical protein n=1 Tax=Neptuniibacter halophilus TaxID=651666 RepID=UPI00257362E6|nr:hypothetical protein [Neptuniibacter halophilus]
MAFQGNNPTFTPGSPLVHLNLQAAIDQQSRISSIMVRERPFLGDLALDTEPDNQALLIALGEVMSVARPLTVNRISCLGRLAILWVSDTEWLVLPQAGTHESVAQALQECFGQDISLLAETSGPLKLSLEPAALAYLLNSRNTYPNHFVRYDDSEPREISIMPLQDAEDYDILIRKSGAEGLWQWLKQDAKPAQDH